MGRQFRAGRVPDACPADGSLRPIDGLARFSRKPVMGPALETMPFGLGGVRLFEHFGCETHRNQSSLQSMEIFFLRRETASRSEFYLCTEEQLAKKTMRNLTRERRSLSAPKRDVLKLALFQEPRALVVDDPELSMAAEQLATDRYLGKVEIRGDFAYRLTEFGRAIVTFGDAPVRV